VASKTRFWNAVLVVLSAGNLVSVWFAAQPGEPWEPWHATIHAALALGFGLWALHRIRPEQHRDPGLTALTDARLDRIERAIDAVAVEVERIGEMERFAAKILAARGSELEPSVPAREPMPPRTMPPLSG
jgi:hypothetical protein